MEERGQKILVSILFLFGILFIFNAQTIITGGAIGVIISPPDNLIVGAVFIIFGLVLLNGTNEQKEGEESRLVGMLNYHPEELMADTISKRAKKGLAHYGGNLIHGGGRGRGADKLYHQKKIEFLEKDYHYELGKIGMFLRSWDHLSEEDRKMFESIYHKHPIGQHGGLGQNTFAIDAPNLNKMAGHRRRGDYRYVFVDHDKDDPLKKKKFLHRYEFMGIATHAGGREYRWA